MAHIPLNNWKYDHVLIKLQKDFFKKKEKLNPSHFQDMGIQEEWPEKPSKMTDIFGALKSHLLVSGWKWVEKMAIQNQNTGPFQ